jgi:hypothetical protein
MFCDSFPDAVLVQIGSVMCAWALAIFGQMLVSASVQWLGCCCTAGYIYCQATEDGSAESSYFILLWVYWNLAPGGGFRLYQVL